MSVYYFNTWKYDFRVPKMWLLWPFGVPKSHTSRCRNNKRTPPTPPILYSYYHIKLAWNKNFFRIKAFLAILIIFGLFTILSPGDNLHGNGHTLISNLITNKLYNVHCTRWPCSLAIFWHVKHISSTIIGQVMAVSVKKATWRQMFSVLKWLAITQK